MRFFFITNSVPLARFAADNNVERIFVDLEFLGKVERQGHLDTLISRHEMADVAPIRAAVSDAELMVRLNPVHEGSGDEINAAINAGADILMLPMFRSATQVERFASLINGRCRLCLLVETKEAMENIGHIAAIEGVDEVHIGLNDLSIDLGLGFMFMPLAMGLVDAMASELVGIGKPFGIGGLARAGEGLLPAQLLIGEHVRLGSTAAILSRTFHRMLGSAREISAEMDFGYEIQVLRESEQGFFRASTETLEANRIEVWRRIVEIDAARQLRC
jgi:2-keto-3-deoxy-L-rhamnonate aldolase RhmA